MTPEELLKTKVLDFVKSVGEEFPSAGKRMKVSMPNIEKDISKHFSRSVLSNIVSYLNEVMKSEVANTLDGKELDFLANTTHEYFDSLIRENRGQETSLENARKLRKAIELQSRIDRTLKKAFELERDLFRQLLGASASNHLEEPYAVKISDTEDLLKKVMDLGKEKDAILKEMGVDSDLYNPGKIAIAKEVLSSKIGRLNRGLSDHKDVEKREFAQTILLKLKKIGKIRKKEQEWIGLEKECGEFFIANGDNPAVNAMGIDLGYPAIGIILLKKTPKT